MIFVLKMWRLQTHIELKLQYGIIYQTENQLLMEGKNMSITVYDLCNLYIESNTDMRIWCAFDAENGGDGFVFDGTFDEAMRSDWANEEVDSFDIEDNMIVINVD